MKYFITGATGFLGGSLARQLRASGHEVIALVRNPDKAGKLKAIGATIVAGDVTDKESMRAPMSGCDGVFHVAGWYKVGARDSSPGQRINVGGTRNVLELMQELKIPKGVYTSSIAINSDTHGKSVDETYEFIGTHLSEYDRTKAEAHKIALQFIASGLPLVILMPGLIYGPDGTASSDEALRMFLQKKLPLMPQKAAYSFSHVDDVAQVHIVAMEKAKPGSTYIVCGDSHTFTEAIDIAHNITGIRKPIAVPPWMMRATSWITALVEKIIPLPDLYSSESLRIQAGVTYLGDNSKAKRELGYNPRPLEVGYRQTIEYEQARLKKQ